MIDKTIEEMNEIAEKEYWKYFHAYDRRFDISDFFRKVKWDLFDVQLHDIYIAYFDHMIEGFDNEEDLEEFYHEVTIPVIMSYWKDQFKDYMRDQYA